MKAGGTVVNYSPLDAEQVLEHKVEDSQTDFLFTLDLAALYPQMGRLLGKTRLKKLIVGEIAEMSGAPDMVAAQMTKTDQLAQVPSDDRHITFAALARQRRPLPGPPRSPTSTRPLPSCNIPAARPGCRKARC